MILHKIKGYIQAMYLVEYPDKLMLLDGASRADIPDLLDFIENNLSRPVTDLKVVVVTHMHPDHAGGAVKLRKITGCKLLAAKRDRHWYCGLDGVLMHYTDLLLALWMASRLRKPKRNIWYPRKLIADIELLNGDAVPGFEDWQILETPGHTDRDISLYHQEQGIVYVADLLVQVKKRLVAPFPVFYPNQYRKSVRKIYELDADSLLTAHAGEVNLDFNAYKHVLETAPERPITHWRVTKIKTKKVLRSLISARG